MELIFILLVIVTASSAQILELPIQDQVPKMLVTDCPNSPYPIVMSSMTSMDLWSNQYVVCLRSVPLIFNCSDGLFFNPNKLTCEFPYERRSILLPHETDVPDLPQFPIPINPDLRQRSQANLFRPSYRPQRPYPITRPNPEVIAPIQVQPRNQWTHPPVEPRKGSYPQMKQRPMPEYPAVILPFPPPPSQIIAVPYSKLY